VAVVKEEQKEGGGARADYKRPRVLRMPVLCATGTGRMPTHALQDACHACRMRWYARADYGVYRMRSREASRMYVYVHVYGYAYMYLFAGRLRRTRSRRPVGRRAPSPAYTI
jgi:hypothetical protein